jgi:SAM-dependent methyltransferase
LKRRSHAGLSVAKAEALPVRDNSVDAITSIFMFHELPPKVRRSVFHECARILRPGGRLVLVDSLQHGDEPDYDGLLDNFPESYHEPYYRSYLNEDFGAIAKAADYRISEIPTRSSPKSWYLTKRPDAQWWLQICAPGIRRADRFFVAVCADRLGGFVVETANGLAAQPTASAKSVGFRHSRVDSRLLCV